MAKNFYLPKADKDKAVWLNNFAGKLPSVSTAVGIAAPEVTAVTNDAAMFSYMINLVEIFNTAKEERVTYKNILRDGPVGSIAGALPAMPVVPAPPAAVPAGIFQRLAQLVQRIKNHPNYTEAIGRTLGIIGAEQIIDTTVMKPVLKLVKKGGVIEIQWSKGHATSIIIQVDRDGSGWKFLAVDTIPHYTDTAHADAPATWKYRAMYQVGDEPVGQWSDEVRIVVGD